MYRKIVKVVYAICQIPPSFTSCVVQLDNGPSPDEAMPEGGVWGVRSGSGHGFYVLPPPVPAWQLKVGQAVTPATEPTYDKGVQGGIHADGHGNQLPCEGMSREGDQLHQPTFAFHSTARRGHHCGHQQGTWTPTPVISV